MEPVLSIADLDIAWGEGPLVTSVNLTVGAGERVGLVGESGSGKSLTAFSAIGLLPDGLTASGQISLNGHHWSPGAVPEAELSRLRGREVSMVFQEPMTALNPTMQVGDQVAEVMRIHRTVPSRAAAQARAVDLLEQMGLPEPARMARAYPHQLSGGQRQRVVMAIAMANRPSLLICDEPTTALDVIAQARILDQLVRSVEAENTAMLMISHDLAVVATVCQRVLVMRHGEVVESGSVTEVFGNPQHPYTQQLVAASHLSVRPQAASIEPGSSGALSQVKSGSDTPVRRESPEGTAMPTAPGSRSQPGRPPKIEVSQVGRQYRRGGLSALGAGTVINALREVDLQIQPGERFGIVGESGSGKSTLLRILAGLDRPTAGTVQVDARTISDLPERRLGFLRDELQLVFQDPAGSLDPRMTVADILTEPLRGVDREQRMARVHELLEQVGLPTASAQRFPHQFSGGQRQRISIARALAPRPSILLADEAVSALDVSVRGQVLDLISSLVDDLGLTLVFVTHDLSVVRHVCDRMAVMHRGEVVEVGPVESIWQAPQAEYTKTLIAAVPDLDRALTGVGTEGLLAR